MLHARPLDGGAFLMVNRVVARRPHDPDRPHAGADLTEYGEPSGLLAQCSSCRCVRVSGGARWVWVPQLVAHPPPQTTHTVCPACLGRYFGPGAR